MKYKLVNSFKKYNQALKDIDLIRRRLKDFPADKALKKMKKQTLKLIIRIRRKYDIYLPDGFLVDKGPLLLIAECEPKKVGVDYICSACECELYCHNFENNIDSKDFGCETCDHSGGECDQIDCNHIGSRYK